MARGHAGMDDERKLTESPNFPQNGPLWFIFNADTVAIPQINRTLGICHDKPGYQAREYSKQTEYASGRVSK